MTLWPKVAKHSVVLSIEATVAPTSGVVVACSRRSPLLTECDQHTRSSGADSNNRLLPSRRILLSSVVLAAGAIAAWNLRKQHVDLHADNSQAQSRTGRGAVAYRGIQADQWLRKRLNCLTCWLRLCVEALVIIQMLSLQGNKTRSKLQSAQLSSLL